MACLAEVVARVRRMLEEQRLPHVMRVFSQGDPAEFRALDLPHDGLFLDADPLWSMREMIDADLLVTTRGTFGHVTGLLCEGVVLAGRIVPASTGLADLRCPRRVRGREARLCCLGVCALPAADSGSASARTWCTRAAPSRSRKRRSLKDGRGARGFDQRAFEARRFRTPRTELQGEAEARFGTAGIGAAQWRTSPRQPIIEPRRSRQGDHVLQRAPKNRRRAGRDVPP